MESVSSHLSGLEKPKKIYVIAGENSGDNILSLIIEKLKNQYPNSEFRGITGPRLERLGVESLFSIYKIAIMGFVEVLPKIIDIVKCIRCTVNDMITFKPDLIITIDAPDFCFRVIKKFRYMSRDSTAKIIHIVAPSVWAYRENRAEKIAKIYNHLLCFLPFEPKYFAKYGLKADFIGHPIVENLRPYVKRTERDKNLLLAMPGSRVGEVKKHWPIMIESFKKLQKKYPNIQIKVPTNIRLKNYLFENTPKSLNISFIIDEQQKYDIYNKAGCAIVKSGTSALEAAIFNCPMVIVYKVNKVTAMIARKLLKIKYVSLINILANEEIIKELLQDDFTHEKVFNEVLRLLESDKIIDYSKYINKLEIGKSSLDNALDIIKGYL